jgi:hypothetical protein
MATPFNCSRGSDWIEPLALVQLSSRRQANTTLEAPDRGQLPGGGCSALRPRFDRKLILAKRAALDRCSQVAIRRCNHANVRLQ